MMKPDALLLILLVLMLNFLCLCDREVWLLRESYQRVLDTEYATFLVVPWRVPHFDPWLQWPHLNAGFVFFGDGECSDRGARDDHQGVGPSQ
jgi:hypothetical protein